MKLQILINHYQESEKIISRLLNSIQQSEAISQNDFEVIIFTDGKENKLNSNFIQSFQIPIIYKALFHKGVCATRNALLDYSNSEYVMFCDADDYFHSTLGLYKIFKAIDDLHYDIIGSPYDCEFLENNNLKYKTLYNDTIRVHGKVFKRQYLIDNNIRFPDEIPISGDMYFLWQAYNLGGSKAWLKESFYLWKYNPNSVTRKNKYHRVTSYPLLLKNYDLLTQNLIERKKDILVQHCIIACIQMMYVNDTNENYIQGPEEDIYLARKSMVNYLKKYKNQYEQVSEDYRKKIFTDLTLKTHQTGKNFEGFEGLTEWMNNLINKYNN